LHPKIHGGLLALRDNQHHMQTCQEHHITLIDLVIVNLYPFEDTISNPNCSIKEAIENIDIGGPSMIRSAAKNYESVGVIVNPKKYHDILKELKLHNQLSLETKSFLCCEAFQHTAAYDAIIAQYLAQNIGQKEGFPDILTPVLVKKSTLRYGENPHQDAAFYTLKGHSGIVNFKQEHGKELSFNNIADLEVAAAVVKDLKKPAMTIIKHNNPCATATGNSILDAFTRAWEADSLSSFGGIVGSNVPIDESVAIAISQFFIEAIVAPYFSEKAFEILSKKPSLRLISFQFPKNAKKNFVYKYVEGGFLIQTPDEISFDINQVNVVTKKQPSKEELEELAFAFHIAKFVKSNAIVISKNQQTLGIGAGQTSRVDAVENAIKKSAKKAKGAVLASDAFFPFRDNVLKAAEAGITAIIQPGGSVRDQESIEACDDHNIAMLFTGIRHFRH
jgi:phosphoribosylaminoimidazolecarboxamide formyltransferase/IMP cyclohydrolase